MILNFRNAIEYQPGTIVSKVLMKASGGTVTLFAFAADQALSEHTAPFDALVQCLEGEAVVTLAGVSHPLTPGESIIMPANSPHAVTAGTDFKMLLTMIKG
ncbi:MAG: cupin domain-containing protein [Acidobacteria bacterium]|nr:cupin domain-containing protein [Acidobacteriota bacterium]